MRSQSSHHITSHLFIGKIHKKCSQSSLILWRKKRCTNLWQFSAMISKTSSTFVFSFMPKDVNFSNAKSNEPEGSLGKQKCRCFFLGGFSFYQSGWKIKMGIKKKSIQVPILFLFSCDLIVCNIWTSGIIFKCHFTKLQITETKNMCWKEFPYHNVTYCLVTSNEIVVACRNTYCWELHIQIRMHMNGNCIWRHQHWSLQLSLYHDILQGVPQSTYIHIYNDINKFP